MPIDLAGAAGLAGSANPFGLAVGATAAGIGSLFKLFQGIKQNKLANQIHPQYTPYQVSPEVKAQLGLARQLYNGRMFGAADQEKNIAASQAGAMANVNRNATDSSQALALGLLSQGQTNNAYNQLGIQEKQNKYDLVGNLNAGYQAMTGERQKVYEDMMRKYEIDTQQKSALRNAAYQNIFGGISDVSSGAMMMAQQQQQNKFNTDYLKMLGGM